MTLSLMVVVKFGKQMMINKVQAYIEYTKKANTALQELLNEAKMFAQENRVLVEGEVVEVYSDGHFICEGVISGCRNKACTSFRNGGLLTMEYFTKEDNFNKAWNTLSYQMLGRKKDGSASTKHAITDSHFIVMEKDSKGSDYYIKRKDNVIFSD